MRYQLERDHHAHYPWFLFLQACRKSWLLTTLGLARANVIPVIESGTLIMLRDAVPAVVKPAMLVLPRTVCEDVLEPNTAESIRLV